VSVAITALIATAVMISGARRHSMRRENPTISDTDSSLLTVRVSCSGDRVQ
jgi:hypothetical protein